VADIENETVGDIRRIDPDARAVAYLETADRILGQHGKAAEIRVGAGTDPRDRDLAALGG
jgi:hypothetical protein